MGAILAVAALSLCAVQVRAMALTRSSRESWAARNAARLAIERMREVGVTTAFAVFNDDDSDDPDGAGTAPGSSLTIDSDAGPMTCSFSFPTSGGALREDLDDARFGTPFDLNGDGTVDSDDHSSDYRVLPVRVRVSWTGGSGAQHMDVYAMLLKE